MEAATGASGGNQSNESLDQGIPALQAW